MHGSVGIHDREASIGILDVLSSGFGKTLRFVLSVAGFGDRIGVDAERNIVEEELLPDSSHINLELNSAKRGLECFRWVASVESQIHGEVVPSARRNAGEGHIAVDGHLCNPGKGTVAPCDDQMITAVVHRCVRESTELLSLLADHRFDAKTLGLVHEPYLRRFPTATVRVDNEHGLREGI